VLVHEMAHAVYILTDFNRARMVMTYVEETNKMLLSQYAPRMSGPMTFDLRTRLSKRDALLKDLEAQAEGVEKKVWRELVESKSKREKGFSLK